MSKANCGQRPAVAGQETGRAARWLLTAVCVGTLAAFGAVALVLLAAENVRYGRHHLDAEVYPGVLRVYRPGDFGGSDL